MHVGCARSVVRRNVAYNISSSLRLMWLSPNDRRTSFVLVNIERPSCQVPVERRPGAGGAGGGRAAPGRTGPPSGLHKSPNDPLPVVGSCWETGASIPAAVFFVAINQLSVLTLVEKIDNLTTIERHDCLGSQTPINYSEMHIEKEDVYFGGKDNQQCDDYNSVSIIIIIIIIISRLLQAYIDHRKNNRTIEQLNTHTHTHRERERERERERVIHSTQIIHILQKNCKNN